MASKLSRRMGVAAAILPWMLGMGVTLGQVAGAPSDQDKSFLKEIDQDSNYEIQTARLALQKSSSSDVKQYATMLIHDHTLLKQQIKVADGVAKVTPDSATSMSVSDKLSYEELKLLKGESFDKAYIKKLVQGNADIQKDEKAEADGSSVQAVKKLAARSVELDSKHAEKAKQLAEAHGIQA